MASMVSTNHKYIQRNVQMRDFFFFLGGVGGVGVGWGGMKSNTEIPILEKKVRGKVQTHKMEKTLIRVSLNTYSVYLVQLLYQFTL